MRERERERESEREREGGRGREREGERENVHFTLESIQVAPRKACSCWFFPSMEACLTLNR